jgi:predicted dehydrogenase
MKKYNWGVIGTGRIARSFSYALRGSADSMTYAVASRNNSKAAAFADENGFTKAYGSYAELAADPDIDAVYIATPMTAHFENASLCLSAGKNVLCEKSVTLNSKQLEELLSLADKKGVFFMEAMWTKCLPAYLKAKEWIRAGKIGDVRYVKADFGNTVKYDPNDRLFRPDCGGGALLDLSVYPLTLAADVLGGEPDEIISSAHIGGDGVDLSNSIMLRYNSGSFASTDSSFEIPLRNNAVISGTAGMILFSDWFFCISDVTLFDRNCKPVETFRCPHEINGYEYEIREFQRCLSEGLTDSPLVPHSCTLAVMRIMDECRRQWGMTFPSE